ncbi:MAG: Tat pathway signal protein, partial [Bryobacterales bacterium]|nr:Tat pathway signal protein [Bryobacterales bacterium]
GRLILHLVNLTSAGTWRAPVDELIPVGPFTVKLRLPKDVRGGRAQLLVANRSVTASLAGGWASFRIDTILDHELILLT